MVLDGHAMEGRALLETDEIVFRGPTRVKIPLADVTSVEPHDGRLAVGFGGRSAVLEIGTAATKWADRILHPKSLIAKLGVRPGSKVAVLGVDDRDFLRQLSERTSDVSRRLRKACDLIFYRAETRDDLRRLPRLEESITRDGAVWVIHPKGTPAIRDVDVIAAAKDSGLVDTKVTRFSETHSALKLVIPVARR